MRKRFSYASSPIKNDISLPRTFFFFFFRFRNSEVNILGAHIVSLRFDFSVKGICLLETKGRLLEGHARHLNKEHREKHPKAYLLPD